MEKSGYLPHFDYDVFISYAHIDNVPVVDGAPGWVDIFHKQFQALLDKYLGKRTRVFRDPRLQGNTVFDESLVETVKQSGVLITIVSPSFANSKWCKREMSTFMDHATSGIGIQVGSTSRIYKVVKLDPGKEKLQEPPLDYFQEVLGYSFCETDSTSGKVREIPQDQAEYVKALNDLAHDVSKQLNTLKDVDFTSTGTPVSLPNALSKETIFISKPPPNQSEQREELRRYLEDKGYRVVPDKPLPPLAEDIDAAIKEYLLNADLAVLMLGSKRGSIPDGKEDNEHTLNQIQYDAITSIALPTSVLKRIWLPTGIEDVHPKQQSILDQVRNDVNADLKMELVQSSLEDLKTLLIDELNKKNRTNGAASDNAPHKVYFIFDKGDKEREDILAVAKLLHQYDFGVLSPLLDSEGDQKGRLLQEHMHNLESCDSVLIYYGEGSDEWRRTKIKELDKVSGSRDKALAAKALYIAPNKNTAKQLAAMERLIDVIEHYDDFKEEILIPFLKKIQNQPEDPS